MPRGEYAIAGDIYCQYTPSIRIEFVEEFGKFKCARLSGLIQMRRRAAAHQHGGHLRLVQRPRQGELDHRFTTAGRDFPQARESAS